MIDIAVLKKLAQDGEVDPVPVSRRCLQQIVDELTAARSAEQHRGECFGLEPGQKL